MVAYRNDDIGERIRKIVETRIPAIVSVITSSIPKLVDIKGYYGRYYVEEKEDKYRIIVEIPGASKEDIKIYAQPKTIYVQAKNVVETKYLPREYRVKIDVEESINIENTKAKYINGILIIEAPKKTATKEISVE